MTAPRLLFFAGSARQASFNKRLAKLGSEIAAANGIDATFLDLGHYPLPVYDGDLEAGQGVPENAEKLFDIFRSHHGVMVMAPEYNASITPLLKNSLDWISRVRKDDASAQSAFKDKVFALAAASPGGTGGMRGLFMVRHLLQYGLGAFVLADQFLLPRAAKGFDDDGHLADKDAQDRFKALISGLAHASAALSET
jgi:chromate reductase, NAD(P)H dehydrogenase (quinone)